MERLTYDFCIGDKHCWQVKGADNLECREVCRSQGDNGCSGCPIAKAFDRLAEYEDTGLEPEEIERILDAYGRGMTLRTENAQRLEIIKDISTGRLRELAQAEKEGRYVRLPCKVGDMVYTIKEDYFNCESCPYGKEAKYDPIQGNPSCDFPEGRHCSYIIKQNRCEGFEVGEKGAGNPGEWGYEGLEEFYSVADFGLYYSREAAEAALAARKEN